MRSTIAALLLPLALGSMGFVCKGVKKEPTDGKTATATLQLKKEGAPEFAVQPIELDVIWKGELLAGTGDVGNTSFETTDHFSGTTNLDGDYIAQELGLSLRPGNWKFVITADGVASECTTELPPGEAVSVNFTAGKQGCLQGIHFP